MPEINSIKNFKFPDTPPQTSDDYWSDVAQNWVGSPELPISVPPRSSSPPLFNYDHNFPPLSKFVPKPPEPRETSFYFLMEVSRLYETSLNTLRHYLTNQASTIFQDQLLKWLITQIIQFQ